MKSLDKFIDDSWKPKKPLLTKNLLVNYLVNGIANGITQHNITVEHKVIDTKYKYSKEICKTNLPHYGADIKEPVLKICERILSKPNRFHLVKEERKEVVEQEYPFVTKRSDLESLVIVDKDTNQKFVVKRNTIDFPTCLSEDESLLLSKVLSHWYKDQMEKIEHNKLEQEQKRKDKFRQELTDLYKDL